jgi:hypothetical protein
VRGLAVAEHVILTCVELSSTLERFRPFDYHSLTAEIEYIPTSLCLYK